MRGDRMGMALAHPAACGHAFADDRLRPARRRGFDGIAGMRCAAPARIEVPPAPVVIDARAWSSARSTPADRVLSCCSDSIADRAGRSYVQGHFAAGARGQGASPRMPR
jgi:hypothetical protein